VGLASDTIEITLKQIEMKKMGFMLLLAVLGIVSTAVAHKTDVINEKVQSAFKQEFVQAKEVTWDKVNDFYRAVFKLNDDVMTAYFSEEGSFLGVVRNLLSTQLPINLQTSLQKQYANYWISSLFEYAKEDGNGYYITIENADQTVVLQSGNGISWSVYSKNKK
jgi:ABC-type uncharacterized transport system fused permease/ATPase subunit